jgi:hypothetical protein
MRSPAPKQAESEFDDLLGQLVDELAMTPPSESAVALVPEPPVPSAEARVDSTHHLAAEAAAAARARVQPETPASNNNLVKIVGIIAGSLTVVAVAALLVFANKSDEASDEGSAVAADQAQLERIAERARAEQAAVEQAQASSIALEQAELRARKLAHEAELLQAKAQASAGEDKAEAPKPKPRPRKRPKPKPKPKPGDSFEDL